MWSARRNVRTLRGNAVHDMSKPGATDWKLGAANRRVGRLNGNSARDKLDKTDRKLGAANRTWRDRLEER